MTVDMVVDKLKGFIFDDDKLVSNYIFETYFFIF